jgi:long-chain-fatty-acid--CoA ligase ACSBG
LFNLQQNKSLWQKIKEIKKIFFINKLFICRGVSCGIYTTNTVEACEHILSDCKSPVVVVENKVQLDKMLQCIERGKCHIRAIIQYAGEIEDSHNGLVSSWLHFMELGLDVADTELEDRTKQMAPNKCSTLIYTSGTTGAPKAAMISQDSMTYLVRNMATDQCQLQFNQERFVSYLPLSHIAAQSVDIYCSIFVGGTTYFAEPDALKGTLTSTLIEAKPTFFFGVPRVLEKMQEKLTSVLRFVIRQWV